MSDTDVDFDYDPGLERQARRQAALSVAQSVEDDPEKAARAVQLSHATGADASAIYPVLDNYEQAQKVSINSRLVADNNYLQDFLNAKPINAKLANDSIANLDEASEKLTELMKPHPFGEVAKRLVKEFTEGVGTEPLGASAFRTDADWAFAKSHPFLSSVAATLSSATELMGRPIAGALNVIAEETGSREIPAMMEYLMMRGDIIHPEAPHTAEAINHNLWTQIQEAAPAMASHILADEIPPRGIHPIIDRIHDEQARWDAKQLKESEAAVDSTPMKDRSPGTMEEFINLFGKKEIGISPEAIRKLYGDKTPAPEDGILGMVPDLDAKLAAAEEAGIDVQVPVKDWLAHVDPEVRDELRDDIRYRPEQETKVEKGEEEKPEPTPPIAEPLPVMRGTAGLEPSFAQGDRKLTLEKRAPRVGPEGVIKADEFKLIDENGVNAGWLEVVPYEGGKRLYIDNVGGFESRGFGPNAFGPALTRDIVRQLKEAYPEATHIGGFRISGAREQAGTTREVWIKFADLDAQARAIHDLFNNFQEFNLGHSLLRYNPELGIDEVKADAAVRDVLARIVGKTPDVFTPSSIINPENPNIFRMGFMKPNREVNPWIVVSLEAPEAVGIARHEGLHYLKRFGFFQDDEWDTLTRAARDNDWLTKYRINERYPSLSMPDKLEEAIAEGYRNWADGQEVPERLHPIFERLRDMFVELKAKLKEILGRDVTWEELFQKIESGEVKDREPAGHEEGAFLEPRMADEAAPTHEPVIDKARWERYQRNIATQNEKDIAQAEKRIAAEERKRQTPEWKQNKAAIRKEVVDDIHARPDVLFDQAFSAGKFKLDAAKLTEEQKKLLPRQTWGRDGLDPDDVARQLGYDTGDRMVNRMGAYYEVKKASGKTGMEFINSMVNHETDRLMEQRYGNLDEKILAEAKARATDEIQLDRLHQETQILGDMAKIKFAKTKGEMLAEVREKFNSMTVGSISSSDFLKASGRLGDRAQAALERKDYAEAFNWKRVQTYNNIYAAEAVKYEKARAQLDRTAKTFRKREVPSVEPEYQNHIQDLLQRAGYRINRSVQNIRENIDNKSVKSVKDFVQAKLSESFGMNDMPLADFLEDPNWRKPIDELTAKQFVDFKNTIDGLVSGGRGEMKIIREGDAYDVKDIRGKMINALQTFKEQPLSQKPSGMGRTYVAGLQAMETIWNRFDRNNPRGVWNKFLTYPFSRAANVKSALQREMAKPLRELGDPGNLGKLIDSPFGSSWPYTTFTRENLLGLLQNAGNRSNWKVVARGWGADPATLMSWLIAHTEPEDWARAQKMGDTIFKQLIAKADREYEGIYGFTIDKIPLEPITNEHGTFPGWYHPLIPDRVWQGKQPVRGYGDGDFGHIATSNGYTRSRTGAIYPVDLSFAQVPKRIDQMIHDIAYRGTIIDALKILKDPSIHNAITKFYGKEYSGDFIMDYIRDMAGKAGIPSKLWAQVGNWSEFIRQNTISTYIGFNPYTVAKHGPTAFFSSARDVGPINLAKTYMKLWGESPEVGKSWYKFAIDSSEELQRRERNWQETLGGAESIAFRPTTPAGYAMQARRNVMQWGAWPVAMSDKLSAVPLWITRFEKALVEGSTKGEAIDLADRSVRRQHGTTAETNQPALVRGGGPLHGWLTSVYGYFGSVMQRRVEILHQMNDTYQLGREGEISAAAAKVPGITADMIAYVLMPIAIEEYVTSLTTENREGWGEYLLKGGAKGVAASFLYLRDFVYAFSTGHDPGVGLLTSVYHDMEKTVNDLKKGRQAVDKAHAGKTIQDFLTTFGEVTGTTPKTPASAARFAIDYLNQQAHPKSVPDVLRGATRGTTQKREEK